MTQKKMVQKNITQKNITQKNITQKNIVICCDGTGNEYSQKNKTNVVRTSEIAVRNDQQLVYYDPGIGTGGNEYTWIEAKKEGATGGGLQKNIEDAYRYLMDVYQQGDQIYLFGFSRGAFTVRSLAGMLHHCGLLHAELHNLVESASKIYNDDDDDLDAGFKETYCRPCPVHFVGVWDTVESLAFSDECFHDDRLNPEIKNAYHAVSIDEKRKNFPPSLWDETVLRPDQTLEQVWFAGVHSDVGGWYPERGLSDITLKWMLDNAKKYGLTIDPAKMKELKPDPQGKQHKSYTRMWKLLGTHKRTIPDGSKVHKSVQQRIDETDYLPVMGKLPTDIEWVD